MMSNRQLRINDRVIIKGYHPDYNGKSGTVVAVDGWGSFVYIDDYQREIHVYPCECDVVGENDHSS